MLRLGCGCQCRLGLFPWSYGNLCLEFSEFVGDFSVQLVEPLLGDNLHHLSSVAARSLLTDMTFLSFDISHFMTAMAWTWFFWDSAIVARACSLNARSGWASGEDISEVVLLLEVVRN